jgi:hypothetical protein
VLGSLATNIASNIIYDLFRKAMRPRLPDREFEYTEVERPDGTRLIKVRVTEKHTA